MPDIATLELQVKHTSVEEATAALERFKSASSKAETGVTRDMNRIADESHRGLGKVENATAALAFELNGISGPSGHIAHLATSLLQFGTGGEVVLAAVAGFAALGLAIKEET